MSKQIFVSKDGYLKLQNELEHLKTVKRAEVAQAIKIYDVLADVEQEFSIVGSTEADPFENKISDDSPLGKALIGSREGDTITVEAPVGILKYTIISITK